MQIILLNKHTLAEGRAAFESYARALVCGPWAEAYESGMDRATGIRIVIGAIDAAIAHGITEEDDLTLAVSRASRCRT